MKRGHKPKTVLETNNGYAYEMPAIVRAAHLCSLSIRRNKGKIIINGQWDMRVSRHTGENLFVNATACHAMINGRTKCFDNMSRGYSSPTAIDEA